MPIQSKSPEEIVKEFKEMIDSSYHTKIEDMENDVIWLRESLASFALYLEGKMPEKHAPVEDIGKHGKYIGDDFVTEQYPYTSDSAARNNTIDECKSILRYEAEEVMKGV